MSRRSFLVAVVVLSQLAILSSLGTTRAAERTEPKPPQPNPAEPVNYIRWINETYGAQVKDNAFDAYQKAYEQIKPFEGDWGDTIKGPWSDNNDVSAWLDANRKGLDLFRAATRQPECFFTLSEPSPANGSHVTPMMINILLPDLSTHRTLVRALIAEGYQAWKKGDQDLLGKNAIVVLRSAHHFEHDPTLIGRLVGIACAQMGYEALRNGFALSKDPGSLATSILSELGAADPPLISLKQAYLCERLSAWDTCQYPFGPDGKLLEDRKLLGLLGNADLVDEWKRSDMDFSKTLREINRYYDAFDRWARTPYHRAAKQDEVLERQRKANENILVKTLVPSLTCSRVLWERTVACRRATHLIVLLFAHHAKTRAFPESLDELTAPDLKQLRIDPFSGKDFVYRTEGKTFTLYSVAANLKDDGGRHDPKWEENDFVFWPVQDGN